MKLDLTLTSEVKRTIRVRQLEAMFSVPAEEKLAVHLTGDLPIEDAEWNIGAIIGPSGSGKTQSLRHLFGEPSKLEWGSGSVIDDFPPSKSMDEITRVCQAVGFNTIPAWMRSYSVLSNGEKFRVEIARKLLTEDNPIIIDEFTSVVDRQVAKITSHAAAKYVRENKKKLVVASCHYDILNWLEPDWTFEPASQSFSWRSLRGRPSINVEVTRVKYEAWRLFAPFHYMSQDLNKAARCYGLFVDGRIAAFCGILHFPHPKVNDIMRFSRMVTLPDWQGLGLAMVLANTVGSAYRALGKRLHTYPNHPAWVRSYMRNPDWLAVKESGDYSPRKGKTSTVGGFGGKTCAVFVYQGKPLPVLEASALINGTSLAVAAEQYGTTV